MASPSSTTTKTLGALALAGLIALTACAPGPTADGQSSAAGTGGTLRVGVVGGSTKDTLDAHVPVTHPDQARVIQLYATLVDYTPDHQIQMALAESLEPSDDAQSWTVTLREGLKFSDGSPITSTDVVASVMRITDPDDPKSGAAALSDLERDAVTTPDELTAVFPFTAPNMVFPDSLAQYASGIVPADYDPEAPVGSGPFMIDSFDPGKQSEFVKNPHYFREGQPALDGVIIIDFPDDTARVNALLGGQVDVIDDLPLGQTSVIEANEEFEILDSPSGSWLPFTMRVDQPPFDDVRVRPAFRLLVDRQEMIDQVLDGRGSLGNDMYAPYDACYPSDIPQREQDIEEAKRLLAAAGKENLEVELVTSPVAAGVVEAAQVFSQQAKDAGVTVTVNQVDPGDFYGDQYLDWTFSQDFWFTRDYLPQTDVSGFANSPFNETHWEDPEWTSIAREARGEVDDVKRCELIAQAQTIEFERGGYIVWGFPNTVDAYRTGITGFVEDSSGIPLSSFAFRLVSMDGTA